jgi:diguanylate cyclase (GGDEF)-like protein/PAS domain S-box-containing protein
MSEVVRVLHLEDNADDAELVRSMLAAEGFEVSAQHVVDRKQYSAALDAGGFDLILSDYTLPAFSGAEALDLARQKAPQTPFIFVSGTMGEEAAVDSLLRGATDYVLKHRMARLVPAVRRALVESHERQERRRAQQALAESEQRLRAAVESFPSPFLIYDRERRILYANASAVRLAGLPAQQLIGRRDEEIFPPSVTEAYLGWLSEAISTKAPREGECALTLAGRSYVLVFSYVPLLDARGEVYQVLAVGHDITERKRSEEALRLRERAIEASVNGLVITDFLRPDNPIVYVNPAFQRLTGYAPQEALGRNGRFLLGTDTDQPGLEAIRSAIREQRESYAVIRNYRKDGSMFWNELHIAPVRDAYGRVTHFVGVQNDVTERKRYEEQLEHQANHDLLTGLPNRNLLRDRLSQALLHADRYGRAVAVAFLDLDNFKLINDSLGHDLGDELLRRVAQRLRSTVREVDTVARIGGDEFVLLLGYQPGEQGVSELMPRLLAAVAEPIMIGERELTVSCSIGFCIYPQDGSDPDALLRNADAAMFRAKELGRSNFQAFTPALHARISERLALEGELRRALERCEFTLHFQPQVEVGSGRIIAVEALLRWNHPARGLVPPASFIPVAEETGLIVPIGDWVVEAVCEWCRSRKAEGCAPLRVAINVSLRQLHRDEFVACVASALARTGVEPQWLELEITESAVMKNPEETIGRLRSLRALGIKIAIDDFGTGYSSLSQLKRLPVDRLKIDRGFIEGIPGDIDDAAIARAVISLGHSLGLKVVAEGVETAAQHDFLLAHGCDEAQGYLFAVPMAAEAIEDLLRGHARPAGAA